MLRIGKDLQYRRDWSAPEPSLQIEQPRIELLIIQKRNLFKIKKAITEFKNVGAFLKKNRTSVYYQFQKEDTFR